MLLMEQSVPESRQDSCPLHQGYRLQGRVGGVFCVLELNLNDPGADLVSQRMMGKEAAIRIGVLPCIGAGHPGMLPGL